MNSALIFSIILTLLRLVFSKEAILFLIYLLADKAKCLGAIFIPIKIGLKTKTFGLHTKINLIFFWLNLFGLLISANALLLKLF